MPKESQPCHFRFLTAAAILRFAPTPLQPACVSTLTSPCLFSDRLPSHGVIDIGFRPAYITRDSSSQDPETHHIMKNPLSTEGHRHSLRRFHKVPLRKRSFSPHSCPTDFGFIFCSLKYPLSGRFQEMDHINGRRLRQRGPKTLPQCKCETCVQDSGACGFPSVLLFIIPKEYSQLCLLSTRLIDIKNENSIKWSH